MGAGALMAKSRTLKPAAPKPAALRHATLKPAALKAAAPKPAALKPAAPKPEAPGAARAAGLQTSPAARDPYADWAVHTGFRAFTAAPGGGHAAPWPQALDLVAELQAPADAAGLAWVVAFNQQALQGTGLALSVPAAYQRAWPGGQRPRFVTLRLDLGARAVEAVAVAEHPGQRSNQGRGQRTDERGHRLADDLARALARLAAHPAITRLQLGHARPALGEVVAAPAAGQARPGQRQAQAQAQAQAAAQAKAKAKAKADADADADTKPAARAAQPAAPAQAATGLDGVAESLAPQPGLRAIVGVLEDELPLAHAVLRRADGRGSRLISLWDQSPTVHPPQPPWSATPGFAQGRFLGPSAIAALISRYTRPDGGLDEARLGADPALGLPALQRRGSHGAAVLGLLASGTATLATPGGPEVPLLAVRLPSTLVPITSGRWLASCALDGVHQLLAQAQALDASAGTGLPVVLNLSYGGAAGAHDGSDLLTCALDELLQAHPRLALVVAAGNTHGTVHRGGHGQPPACWPSGLHAGPAPLSRGSSLCFALDLPADKSGDTALELWFSHAAPADTAGPQHLPADLVEVSLWPPGAAAPWLTVRSGGQALHRVPAGATAPVVAGLLFPLRVSQSRGRSMALLMLAGTARGAGAPAVPAGVWQVQVRLAGAASRDAPFGWQVEAWVERDDLPGVPGRPQGARLLGCDSLPPPAAGQRRSLRPVPASDHNTLAGTALGQHVASAGALVDSRDDQGLRMVSPYSARARGQGVMAEASTSTSAQPPAPGATALVRGPSASAVADQGLACAGLRVAGHGSGQVLRANGTSMAAPQLACHLAWSMAAGATRAEALARLADAPGTDLRRGPDIG